MAKSIKTWQQFGKNIRNSGENLLARVPEFENLVFVTGCQRSGTTILTNIFLESQGFVDYRGYLTIDSELDGALILSGYYPYAVKAGRYCFQTTYLNENYFEYYDHLHNFKMIFVIRNPYSVVYSMCYHWKRRLDIRNFALNELFEACGQPGLYEREKKMFKMFGTVGIPKLRKACLSYVSKLSQLFVLYKEIKNALLVVDYDDIIKNKNGLLLRLFSFLDHPYDKRVSNLLHMKSISRADKLSEKQKKVINETCWGTYLEAKKLISNVL